VVAEIGDPRRFSSPRPLMAFLGTVPSEHSTGDSVRRGGITKTGNQRARKALIEAAWTYTHRRQAPTPTRHPAALRTIADGIPGARLVVVPGAHLANVESPDAVTAALLAHLRPAGETVHARGMRVRREVLGDAHVDRAVAGTTDLTAPFQDLITRYAWGEIWARPGLTRAERSIITLTALATLRQEEELALHTRAALRNGLTQEQIGEVLLQVAVYAGVPAANRAFAVAQRVFAETAAGGGDT